ncbi:hypothetical protein [Spongiimicrobium salis]|uniref:hypothetical protein n=1 Tax=Spongiimicrobium salis TaxID=1667022 RepID=UPI00374D8C71
MNHVKKIGILSFLLGVLAACQPSSDVLSGSGVPEKKIALAYFQDQYNTTCNSINFWIFNDGTVVYKSICDEEGTTEIEAKISPQEMNSLLEYIADRSSQLSHNDSLDNVPVTVLKYADTKYIFNSESANVAFRAINSKIEGLITRTIH